MARKRTGSLLGTFYVLLGAALLGSALFAPWYYYDSYSEQHWGTPGSPTSVAVGPSELYFYLFGLPGSGSVQSTCPRGNISNFCPTSSSYSHAGLNGTGQVAALTLALAAAGFAVAAISGALGVIGRRRARTLFPEMILTLVAIALAVAATAAFAVLLPGAFAHDLSASQRGYGPSGPWSSFSGSVSVIIPMACVHPGCLPMVASWGPVGWVVFFGRCDRRASRGSGHDDPITARRCRTLTVGRVGGIGARIEPADPREIAALGAGRRALRRTCEGSGSRLRSAGARR